MCEGMGQRANKKEDLNRRNGIGQRNKCFMQVMPARELKVVSQG
jgi:hypothetical protein